MTAVEFLFSGVRIYLVILLTGFLTTFLGIAQSGILSAFLVHDLNFYGIAVTRVDILGSHPTVFESECCTGMGAGSEF